MSVVSDDDFVRGNQLSKKYSSTLNDISNRDYRKAFFKNDRVCIDLDAYEDSFKKAQPEPTMDAAIGVADKNEERLVNRRFLLVELRLNYKSSDPLSSSNMISKVKHSKELLRPSNIDKQSVFVFTKTVSNQAKNYFFRYRNQYPEMRNWIAKTPEEFDQYVNG